MAKTRLPVALERTCIIIPPLAASKIYCFGELSAFCTYGRATAQALSAAVLPTFETNTLNAPRTIAGNISCLTTNSPVKGFFSTTDSTLSLLTSSSSCKKTGSFTKNPYSFSKFSKSNSEVSTFDKSMPRLISGIYSVTIPSSSVSILASAIDGKVKLSNNAAEIIPVINFFFIYHSPS
ncbi:hypothetical protein BCE_5006 [Bacillus cereus ATCC 10987]|uniref:Uncharacterized protein n=1 Tax=Bacillus cereus (strain ATCC 10987 / NRS 248) TaxID=222523 RepID=Q72YL5_BACC1|nr:hypothetical protein BCE_5006 [Bacillus cereus ATCC 10987]